VISFTQWPVLAAHSARESNLVFAMNAQEVGWRAESPDTGKIQFYRELDWSAFEASLRARSVQRVHIDAEGKIWLGGSSELIMFDGQSWQPVAMPQIGLIEDITSDVHGRIYIAGYNGIAIYDPAADRQP
jgi:ligand-binding sensor domain-containing protein